MPITIPIIFQDSNILVINKPSGIIVNNSQTAKNEVTIQDWAKNFINLSGGENVDEEIFEEFKNRNGIVHRLDKETSGVLIIAKNVKSFQFLKSQFMNRVVKKTYLALVHGEIKPNSGTISAPIGREIFNRTKFGVVAGGRDATTEYKTLEVKYLNNKKEPLSLIELYPLTGRTHQIRVHLKYLGYPIFSDELYAGRKTARDDRKYLNRFFLHAKSIEFIHPKTLKKIFLEAPLPEELNNFIASL